MPGDPRFTIRRLWDDRSPAFQYLYTPVRVTHTETGLFADLPRVKFSDITPGKAVALISGRAVDVLGAHVSDRSQRAVAIMALDLLQVIGAFCHCGGYLHYGIGGVWRHVNVCRDCLADPSACAATIDRRRHRGYCATPAPAQCEHDNCRRPSQYDASRGCGHDFRCCGSHDCDTAVPEPVWPEGFFVPVQAPASPELRVTV